MQPIAIQPRDLLLMKMLGRIVLMDQAMIQEEFFPLDQTGKACATRLRLLCDHDLIGKIAFPLVSFTDARPQLLTCYRLKPAGADLLTFMTGSGPERLPRTHPSAHTVLHRRDVARVMRAVDTAAHLAGLPEPQLILEQDQRQGVARNAPRTQRFILYEDFRHADGTILRLRPDGSSCLRFPGKAPGTWHELLVWWELDRSTETLDQIALKVPPYQFLLRSEEPDSNGALRRVFRRHWPTSERATLRVFFVCPSLARIQSISGAIRALPGAEFIRLATMDSLQGNQLLRSPIWYDVLGNTHTIYPTGPVAS